MKKLMKNEICGSVNSAQMHCSLWKSQHLRLLFNEQCMNSSCISLKRVKAKKKKEKRKKRTKTQLVTNADAASMNPNGHYNKKKQAKVEPAAVAELTN